MHYVDGILEKVRVNILKKIQEVKEEQHKNPKKIDNSIYDLCILKLEDKLNKIDEARGILKQAWEAIA